MDESTLLNTNEGMYWDEQGPDPEIEMLHLEEQAYINSIHTICDAIQIGVVTKEEVIKMLETQIVKDSVKNIGAMMNSGLVDKKQVIEKIETTLNKGESS